MMKTMTKSFIGLGLIFAVMSTNAAAATASPADQALAQCQAQYQKLSKQSKMDRPAITKAIIAEFKKNQKHKDLTALKNNLRRIASTYLKNEFSVMKDAKTLAACQTAAAAKKESAYLPLMAAYLANNQLAKAVASCHQAHDAQVKDANGHVVKKSMCSKLKNVEAMLQA